MKEKKQYPEQQEASRVFYVIAKEQPASERSHVFVCTLDGEFTQWASPDRSGIEQLSRTILRNGSNGAVIPVASDELQPHHIKGIENIILFLANNRFADLAEDLMSNPERIIIYQKGVNHTTQV